MKYRKYLWIMQHKVQHFSIRGKTQIHFMQPIHLSIMLIQISILVHKKIGWTWLRRLVLPLIKMRHHSLGGKQTLTEHIRSRKWEFWHTTMEVVQILDILCYILVERNASSSMMIHLLANGENSNAQEMASQVQTLESKEQPNSNW